VKLNFNGIRVWHTFTGSGVNDKSGAIAVDSSGNVYVAGYSPATWGTPVHPHAGGLDAFVAKIIAKARDDILGTWDSSGVWYRNTLTGAWVNITAPAHQIAAGHLDIDGISDIIGVWSSGLWVKYSLLDSWIKLTLSPPTDIASGDMDGDGRDEVVATWAGSGVWYRDPSTGLWIKLSSAADLVAAGDIEGDGIDDLIGVWSSGLWVRFSSSGGWARLTSSPPSDIATGDMNGNGLDDVVATWSSSGVWYGGFQWSGAWTWGKLSSAADLIAAGDMEGDGTDDLIGVWSSGLWVKYSSNLSWYRIYGLPLPTDIDAGLFRLGAWDAGALSFDAPLGGHAEGPGNEEYIDLSDEGPGGKNFVYQEEGNLVPHMSEVEELKRLPGPGEPGFTYSEQKNLVPRETEQKKKAKKD
jgi:hypothetical protein